MGSKLSGLTDGLMSVLKAVPLIIGAAGGLFIPSHGGASDASPLGAAFEGKWKESANYLVANYTFYEPWGGKFTASEGIGVKMGIAGVIVHKILVWIDG
jgi:hypothetical protein